MINLRNHFLTVALVSVVLFGLIRGFIIAMAHQFPLAYVFLLQIIFCFAGIHPRVILSERVRSELKTWSV